MSRGANETVRRRRARGVARAVEYQQIAQRREFLGAMPRRDRRQGIGADEPHHGRIASQRRQRVYRVGGALADDLEIAARQSRLATHHAAQHLPAVFGARHRFRTMPRLPRRQQGDAAHAKCLAPGVSGMQVATMHGIERAAQNGFAGIAERGRLVSR